MSAAQLRFYEKNKERLNAENKAYREANKETLAAKQKARRDANLEDARAKGREADDRRRESARNPLLQLQHLDRETWRHTGRIEAGRRIPGEVRGQLLTGVDRVV